MDSNISPSRTNSSINHPGTHSLNTNHRNNNSSSSHRRDMDSNLSIAKGVVEVVVVEEDKVTVNMGVCLLCTARRKELLMQWWKVHF